MRRRAGIPAVALALLVALAGCAATPSVDATTSYDSATAQRLQDQVLAVSRDSAQGEWSSAAAGLDRLVASAQQAADAGLISSDRLAGILAAVASVRADLQAAIAATPSPTPTKPGHGNGNGNGNGNGTKPK